MDFQNMKVLVLDGNGRQALPILKDLHDLNCDISIICYSKLDVGYASRYAKHKLLFKNVDFDDDAVRRQIIKDAFLSKKYDIIIPLSDKSTQIISENYEEYSKYAKSPIPGYSVFMKAYDKQQTMEICQKHNIPCTRTKEEDESINDFASKIGFPLVIKPRSACGSIGFRCLQNVEELKELISNDEIDISQYVIQEYVNQNGAQYNIHLFMGDDENIKFAVATQKCRWFPVDGGASCFCRTINRPDLVEQCSELLKAIHWRGYCEIEMIEDKDRGTVKVIEINGRTSASIKICQLDGVNVAKNMLELAVGEEVTSQLHEYKDVRMRCIHTDLLWFAKSKNRWNSKPSWFNSKHTHDQIFSVSDPFPFVTFSLQSLFRVRGELKKRNR